MKIIIDERERDLYEQCYSIVNTEGNTTFIQLSKQVLPIGDILIQTDEDKPVMLIERKSFSDLLASIKDGRYEEQSYRLTYASGFPMHNIMYLIEGMFSQVKSIQEKKLLYSTMTSLNYFKGFSIYRAATVRESAEWLIWTANKIERDFLKGKCPHYLFKRECENTLITDDSIIEADDRISNDVSTSVPYCNVVKKVKKENVTTENIGEIILCQIPGISSVTAVAIMKKFQNFLHLLEELKQNPSVLDDVQYETKGKMRKISKSCIESIKTFLITPSEKKNETI